MPYNPIEMRFKNGIAADLAAASLPRIVVASIVVRPTLSATGLKPPAIVISPGRDSRKSSPAGMRVRELIAIVSPYFVIDGTGVDDEDTQEQVLALIKARYDVPSTMPAALTSAVPELQELRVRSADSYLPANWRAFVGAHRIAVAAEVCQMSSVA